MKIAKPTSRSTKRYEAGTSASAVEHNRGGASKSRLRDIVTNAAIDLTDIKPERINQSYQMLVEGGGSPGVLTEHLSPSFLAEEQLAADSIKKSFDKRE